MTQIRARIHDKDPEERSLFESILKQRGIWLKAEALWPKVEPLFREGRQVMKQGVVLQRAVETNTAGRSGPAANRVTHQLPELKAFCWAIKCLVRRFSKSYALSLCWANHLEDGWESASMSAAAPDLIPLVAAIRDWREDSRLLLEYCKREEEDGRKDYELERYGVPDLHSCWYTCGSPADGALSRLASDLVDHVPSSKSFMTREDEDDIMEAQVPQTATEQHIRTTQVIDNPTPLAESVTPKPAIP
ncbi:hypothetical protein FRC11_002976, partial [Ceratobasidium sp. 423]